MMELQEFKTSWQKQAIVGYSHEELDSIFAIKQHHSLAALKTGLTWDLVTAIVISIGFIITLQMLDLRTSDFWSACMAIFAIQHVIFYQIQLFLLKRNSNFVNNVKYSITLAIGKIKVLLWIYRLWPATLTVILAITYVMMFKPNVAVWMMLIIGLTLATVVAALSNIISAVLVRKHLLKLENLQQELLILSK
jgi:hypothetical protein